MSCDLHREAFQEREFQREPYFFLWPVRIVPRGKAGYPGGGKHLRF